jgi:diacylglycerol kinase family enzyme
MSCDGGAAKESEVSGVIASNTRHLANFLAFTKSNCGDGFFELMELNAGFFRQTAHNVSALLGARFYNPSHPVRTQRVHIRLNDPQDLMIDGEFYEDVVSIDIQILPSALACGRRVQLSL